MQTSDARKRQTVSGLTEAVSGLTEAERGAVNAAACGNCGERTAVLRLVAHIKAEAVQAERERVLALMEAVLARVRCEVVHRQANGGRCANCISWAKNVGAPKYLAHARGES